jgi:F-type H+-transporting ATPase subunit a
MAAGPIEQFEIHKVVSLPVVRVPGLGPLDLSITNSTLSVMLAFVLVSVFMAVVTARPQVVPGRTQTAGELIFGMIDDLAHQLIGHDYRKYFPFAFTLFLFILAMNMLGLFLIFTATSQLAITATLALMTIALVIVVGFAKNGIGFFKLFVPSGVPIFVLPFVVLIEFVSFLLRPFTLALRLFGNMMGGHVALKVFAGFIIALGGLAAGGGLGLLGIPGAVLSLGGVVALTALEFLVAFLQAFVFTVLTCIYLNDVVNLGHGH